ncbi:MAG: T9SS type A sorting domain-containing protein, partial [Flavobacteriales bacterium]|nr:T9SS type A sorting domain-containing protein [Flavobacteriales bacterium]
ITLKNNGTVIMTSATITYGMDGGPAYLEEWSGNLLPGQTANVSLPAIPVLAGENVLSVGSSAPNGSEDQSPLNDTWTFTFTASVPAAIINLILTLDNYGSDITWHLDSEIGTTLHTGGPYADFQGGTVDSVAFCLTNGCYTFTINDAFGDGLCCDAGEGRYVIRDMQGTEYAVNDGRFGESNTDDFCLTGVSVAEQEHAQALNVFPNPSDGTFTVDLSRMDVPSHYVLTNALGRVIVYGTIPTGTTKKTFELGNEAPGLYLITVRHARGRAVQRVVLDRAQ